MPRRMLPPRLYLDPTRQEWIIRDGSAFVRTGYGQAERHFAEVELENYRSAVTRKENVPGFVYFVSAMRPDYPVKIGYTARMALLRVRSIQTNCPYPIVILGHMPGDYAKERELHQKFDHLKMLGEWFRRAPELMAFIQAHAEAA